MLATIIDAAKDWKSWQQNTSMMTISGVVLCFTALLLLYTTLFSKLRAFPGPLLCRYTNYYTMGQVIIGRCHKYYCELHSRHGPIVRIGPKRLSIADPEAVPIIYGANSKFLKAESYGAFSMKFNGQWITNIFTTRDPHYHKKIKSAMVSVYSVSSVQQTEDLVDKNIAVFISKMRSKDRETVDVSSWFQWFAFDVICSITFNRPMGFLQMEADVNGVIKALDVAFAYSSVLSMAPKLHEWLLGSDRTAQLLSAIPWFHNANLWSNTGKFAEEAIKEYDSRTEEAKSACTDILAGLRRAQKMHEGRISDQELRGFLLANLTAGSDTTAIAIRTIFYQLVRNPRVYARLMDEIKDAEAAGRISPQIKYQEGMQMKYLQAVIKESHRIHPGQSMPIDREVPLGGANLAGQFIPEGTIVGINPWVVHMDKQIYGEDSAEFRPERWLEASVEQRAAMERAFLTFGGGSRICIGRHIANLEMTKLVPSVLRAFRIEWADPEVDWNIESRLLPKQRNMPMRFIPIDTAV